ncbi:TetR/AcrR family transcriptional regulator [Pseudomonas sichuanensis]|uniref:TetR/AcrR family transcriptional regulator n=1 Tax=Pseudomonas sichuanensis TaxID=2213015 RepID=UPI00215EE25B|nr:TetR/AcrR family transcriptional regulator [Pseudomonas sichuanensis]UVK83107.1 TetR/AcrR family transcriptional regulator [Pseudomonas sichuanensis]
MKVSKAQVQANRAHIVQTASVLFRERGYDGVGIADLMAAAGFTHGGFYKHFASKAELLAEAATCGFAQGAARADKMDGLEFVKYYLSREHRDARGDGCTMAALSADAGRRPELIKAAFASGLESMLATLASKGSEADSAESESRAQGIVVIAQVVGALILSRACPDDSTLADEILEACCADVLTRLSSRTNPSSHS